MPLENATSSMLGRKTILDAYLHAIKFGSQETCQFLRFQLPCPVPCFFVRLCIFFKAL